jgi:hypothetical protein
LLTFVRFSSVLPLHGAIRHPHAQRVRECGPNSRLTAVAGRAATEFPVSANLPGLAFFARACLPKPSTG